MEKLKRNSKGVTLIALVVTIIVLIILAGVSISILTGDNGIIKRANQAKEATRGATVEETVKLEVAHNYMSDSTKSTRKGKNQVISELYENQQLTADEVSLLDENDTITIGGVTIDFSILNYTPQSNSIIANEIKITNSKIFDCQRSPAYPETGDTFTGTTFIPAYKTGINSSVGVESGHYLKLAKLGKINDLTDTSLKTELQSKYSQKNYPVVRFDEYDENNNLIGKYSEGGILYEIDINSGIYLLIAAQVNDADNSFGYVFCTKSRWPDEYYNVNPSQLSVTIPNIGGVVNTVY